MTLVEIVKSRLGTDASPLDKAADGVGCAETVSTLLSEYLAQRGIAFSVIVGTYELWREMQKRTDLFERVFEPQAGDIVMCATGTSERPDLMPHGHTGIYLDEWNIASNSSKTGTLESNYTRETWRALFHYYGRYPVYLFRCVARCD